MREKHSKSELLYEEIKRALQTGRYVPGQRIDPSALAQEFNTSPTPVRFALYRLVGEGLIDDQAREGFHVPRITELSLRELYDWLERLLLIACEAGPAQATEEPAPNLVAASDDDVVMHTAHLFNSIALSTDNACLYRAVRRANDKLTPVRRVAVGLLDQTTEEFIALHHHWQNRELQSLKLGLIDYHQRRREIVPHIVAAVNRAPARSRKKQASNNF